jgi:uncharacterized coiled-coil DUF342 family protein
MFQRLIGAGAAVAIVAAVVTSTGCNSAPTGQQAAEKASVGLHELRDEIIATRQAANMCSASLDGLMTGKGPLRERYETYAKSLKTLKGKRDDTRERYQSMAAKAQDYLDKWDAEIAKIGDDDLRANAAKRHEKVEQACKDIRDKLGVAREAFVPYVKELEDIDTYLQSDLTEDGVKASTPKMQKAIADASTIQGPIDSAIATIEHLSRALSSASQAPK